MEANRDKRNKSVAGDHHNVKKEELSLDKTQTGLLIKNTCNVIFHAK